MGLYGEDPDDRLAADLVVFLRQHDGYCKGSATELHKQLVSSAKPDTADVLSKNLGELAGRNPGFSVAHGYVGKRRAITLSLENGVGSVGSVGNNDDCGCRGNECLECLTQELPFDNA